MGDGDGCFPGAALRVLSVFTWIYRVCLPLPLPGFCAKVTCFQWDTGRERLQLYDSAWVNLQILDSIGVTGGRDSICVSFGFLRNSTDWGWSPDRKSVV